MSPLSCLVATSHLIIFYGNQKQGVMLELLTTKSKPVILAPMVGYSHLPFRLLCRKYGAELAVTPMIHSKCYYQQPKYRSNYKFDDTPIAQICGNSVEHVLNSARLLEPHCSAIDLNLGCPQQIASRGNYGAFLMEKPEVVSALVEALCKNINVPISCKVRIFDKFEDTLKWCLMLQNSGAKLITVHGRTRGQRGQRSGLADWKQIKRIKQELTVPVVANGNILYSDDIKRVFDYTQCDGLEIAETALVFIIYVVSSRCI